MRTQNTKNVCVETKKKRVYVHGVATIIMLCNVEVNAKRIEDGIEHYNMMFHHLDSIYSDYICIVAFKYEEHSS